MPRLGFPRKPRSAARLARRLFPLAALLAALLLLPLAVACSEPPPLKIGLLLDFSGPAGSGDLLSEQAFDLAIKQVNEGGGVFGQPVQVVKANSGQNPETSAAAARTLIESDGIHALVGPSFSAGALAVIEQTAPSIPVISPAATSPRLTAANDNDFLFRTALADNIQGPVLARVTRDQGVANVGVIYRDDAWGQGLSDAFLSAWDGPAAAVAFGPEQTTFLPQLQETAAGGAEALVVIAFSENAVTIVQEAVEAGLYDRFTFGDGSRSPAVVSTVGGGILGGMMGVSPATDVGTESSAAWEGAWQAEYGALPEEAFVKETYDAAIALALAAQAADSVDGAAIRDQLRQVAAAPGDRAIASADSVAAALKTLADGGQVNYEGATGKMNWDENGDRQSGYTSVWRFTADGRIEDVEVIPIGN